MRGLRPSIGEAIVWGMNDQKRRYKISLAGSIIGLTGVAFSCGHLLGQPGVPLALSVVGLVILFAAVMVSIWRLDA